MIAVNSLWPAARVKLSRVSFFRTAFPKVTEKLGIVYTPVEIVDFIIHSVEDTLQKEFGRSMSDENVRILDPFTGTGTFITHLLQSGIIKDNDLKRKYAKEIHANEIVLLAYYIASINIENVYHEQLKTTVSKGVEYTPFPGICLTDTFQLGETKEGENLFSELFPQNSERVLEQQKTPLRIITGNPPYSKGQKLANDNTQNVFYPKLEKRISETYTTGSTATNMNKLYDSYVKAFRWASDRIDVENGGIIAFITNGSWVDKGSFGGMRRQIEKKFSAIYVFNLRGVIRAKTGETAKREGQNVFDIMTGVAITLLIKKEKTTIYYYDIGDYLNRKTKLETIKTLKNVSNIQWTTVIPDKNNDWLGLRNDKFTSYIPYGTR